MAVLGQDVKIGLYPDNQITSLVFSAVKDTYKIYTDTVCLSVILPGEILYARLEDNKIRLLNKTIYPGLFSELELRQQGKNGTFQLKPVSPVLNSADYEGDLILVTENDYIQIINKIDIEKYVSAVIEAEGGSNAPVEYYKAQAVLIRTYAIKNMFRHGAKNYNLCSTEHCQVYRGKSLLNSHIQEATYATRGMVLTDSGRKLVTAPYHANCGGQTGTSDIAWQIKLPCLISVNDPFCVNKRNHSWTKKIPLKVWTGYLRSQGVNTNGLSVSDFVFRSPFRTKYYTVRSVSIPLRKIREDFNLKSSFFQIVNDDAGEVVIQGKGFGHGVGLCQDGAIEMARVGYTYVDIIHFYYQNVLITNIARTETRQ